MSNDLMRIRQEELAVNPTNRVPVLLCLDASGSMLTVEQGAGADLGQTIMRDNQTFRLVSGGRTRMDELNEGIHTFMDAIKQDPVAAASVEICVVTFSDNARMEWDFQSVANFAVGELVAAEGSTNLGAGVDLGLDILERRKEEYKRAGVDYFQPWLVLMTDGQPTTVEHIAAGARTRNLEEAGKLTVFPIAIGKEGDLSALAMFSTKRPPLRLKGLNFRDFFQWLSKSVSRVSQSRPGEKVRLDLDAIKGWAEL